jgi:hypothetical protein
MRRGDLPPVVQPELIRDGRLVEVMREWHFGTFDLSVVHLGNRHIAPNNAGEPYRSSSIRSHGDGIGAPADPLFEPRANIYLMSGSRRRAAGGR